MKGVVNTSPKAETMMEIGLVFGNAEWCGLPAHFIIIWKRGKRVPSFKLGRKYDGLARG